MELPGGSRHGKGNGDRNMGETNLGMCWDMITHFPFNLGYMSIYIYIYTYIYIYIYTNITKSHPKFCIEPHLFQNRMVHFLQVISPSVLCSASAGNWNLIYSLHHLAQPTFRGRRLKQALQAQVFTGKLT